MLCTCVRWLARALLGGLLGGGLALPARAQAWQRDSVLSRLGAASIVADPTGFLWVSTETGVFRYDGHQAVPLNDLLAPGSARLPTANAQLLFLPDGALWCGTQRGLFRFVLATRQLERVALPALPNGQIIIGDLYRHPRTGHVWVQHGGMLVVLADRQPVGAPVPLPSGNYGVDFDAADGIYLFDENRSVRHFDGHGRPLARQPTTRFRWRVPGSGGRWQADFGALYDTGRPAPDGAGQRVAQWDTTGFNIQHFRPVAHGRTWYWQSMSGQLVALTPQPHGQPPPHRATGRPRAPAPVRGSAGERQRRVVGLPPPDRHLPVLAPPLARAGAADARSRTPYAHLP